jgi:hypothetical protein
MADATHLREAIEHPQAQIVAHYTSTEMPRFRLSNVQVDQLVASLKSIGPPSH